MTYIPTPQQQQFAMMLADPNNKMTMAERAREIGVTPKTLYAWMNNQDFMGYVSGLIDKNTDMHLAYAWKCLVDRMQRDTNAIRLFFELKDKIRQRLEVTGQTAMTVKFEGIPRPQRPEAKDAENA